MAECRSDQRLRFRIGDRFAQRRDRFLGPPGFEQNLAFEFEEIRIFGIGGDQGVDLVQRLLRIGTLVPSVSTGVARGHALVAFGIFAQRPLRLFHIAEQFGLHALEAGFELGVAWLVPRRIDDIDLAQRLDAIARQRVRAAVGLIIILFDGIAKFEIL